MKEGSELKEYDLILLAIFNCSGGAKSKAELLFDVTDKGSRNEMTREVLSTLLEDIHRILVTYTFALA
jgi:hypothetical protein